MAAAMPHLSGRSRRGLDIATAGAALLILLGLSRVTPVTAEAAGAPTQRAKAREARAEARAAEETALLGPRFRAFETRWFVLVTDTSADRASALAAALDGAADRFLDISQRWGARVSRPEGRMLVVFFAHQRDFLVYAGARDSVNARWMGGYYSSRRNAVALYDDATSGQFAQAIGDAADAPDAGARAAALLREAHEATEAKAVHEAVHLLAFNTGLQRPGVVYPLWLTEGLAESFARGSLSGCARTSDSARRAAQSLQVDEAGAVLGRFTAPSGDAETIEGFYADSRRLFDALLERAPGDLAAFFADVASARQGAQPDPQAVAAMFAARFGRSVGGAAAAAEIAQANAAQGE